MVIENPFIGPKSYEEGDAFFGREKEKKEVTNLIRNETLTLLFSRSGTGKSSLVKAGLIPVLRKNFEYLPVYIHLNDSNVNENSSDNLCAYVIDRCKEEINKHFGHLKNIGIILPNLYNEGSLFEFLTTLGLTQCDENNDKYVIKPLIIFDQFEEIFTHVFTPDRLKHLIAELRYLIESQLPDYLNTAPIDIFTKIKSGLISKQKNYRILFSFREEFLPQFESLRTEIPFIQYTNSRYRLESFSRIMAKEVIIDTDNTISDSIAYEIVENLAINILTNFEKIVVEPFLLSLVCQKIYHNIFNLADQSQERKEEIIKELVDSSIENYIDDIYNVITEQTKEFIEMELITSDKKRTPFNYNDATANPHLKKDVDLLIGKPEYRLLNKEEFLDSPHIEILHDRLLPPLASRRDERLKKLDEAALEMKKKEFEDIQKSKRQKNNVLILLVALFISAVALFVLMHQQGELRAKDDALHTKANLLLSKTDSLQSKTIALRDYADKLTKSTLFLEYSRDSLNDVTDSLKQTTLKKDESLSYFHGVADTNISYLNKQNPLKAMAEAQANYERLKAIYSVDNDIVAKFGKTYLETFNNNLFYSREPSLPFNIISSVGNTFFMKPKAYDKDPVTIGFKIDTNKSSVIDQVMLLDIKDRIVKRDVLTLIKPNSDSTAVSNYDRRFILAENFVYTVKRSVKDNYLLGDTIFLWKIHDKLFRKTPVIIPITFPSPVKIRSRYSNNLITVNSSNSNYYSVAYLDSANIIHATVYDLKRDIKMNNDFKLLDKLVRLYSIDSSCSAIITNSSDSKKLRLYREDKTYLIEEKDKDKKILRAFFYNNKVIVYSQDSESFFVEFRDLEGALIDSLTLPGGAETFPKLMLGDLIIAFDENNNVILSKKGKRGYRKVTINIRNNRSKDDIIPSSYYAISKDKSLLAFAFDSNSIVIVDLNKEKVLKKFTFPEAIMTAPSFYGENKLTVLTGENIYKLYYKSISKAKNIDEITGKLKVLLQGDFKNYKKELEKYQADMTEKK